MKEKKTEKEGLFRSILTAHVIVLLHILILAAVGLTVVLFKGVYDYLPWIMGGIGILILLTAWFFYRHMRSGTQEIHNILSMPQFQDRSVEVKLVGGLASFKLNAPKNGAIDSAHQLPGGSDRLMLEEKTAQAEGQFYTLKILYQKDLITKEEYEKAKQTLIQGEEGVYHEKN